MLHVLETALHCFKYRLLQKFIVFKDKKIFFLWILTFLILLTQLKLVYYYSRQHGHKTGGRVGLVGKILGKSRRFFTSTDKTACHCWLIPITIIVKAARSTLHAKCIQANPITEIAHRCEAAADMQKVRFLMGVCTPTRKKQKKETYLLVLPQEQTRRQFWMYFSAIYHLQRTLCPPFKN